MVWWFQGKFSIFLSFARSQPCEYRFLSALGGQLSAFTRRYADENRAAPQTAFSAASDELFFRQKSKNRRAKVTPRYDEGFRTADGGRYNIDDYRISAYSYRAKAHTSPAARHTAVRAYIYICRRHASVHRICRYNAARNREQLYIICKKSYKKSI